MAVWLPVSVWGQTRPPPPHPPSSWAGPFSPQVPCAPVAEELRFCPFPNVSSSPGPSFQSAGWQLSRCGWGKTLPDRSGHPRQPQESLQRQPGDRTTTTEARRVPAMSPPGLTSSSCFGTLLTTLLEANNSGALNQPEGKSPPSLLSYSEALSSCICLTGRKPQEANSCPAHSWTHSWNVDSVHVTRSSPGIYFIHLCIRFLSDLFNFKESRRLKVAGDHQS